MGNLALLCGIFIITIQHPNTVLFVQFISPRLKLIDLSFICVFAWLFSILIVLCSVMQHINTNVRKERPNPGLKWRYSIFRALLIVKVVIIEFE